MSILVHGGAWRIPQKDTAASLAGVRRASEAGYAVLQAGGSALDAVEAAVRVLEDDPVFDAGTGSVLNAAGAIEMDAIICDGKTLKTGAVACVKDVKNCITLARAVMDKTGHCLLVGEGAEAFARQQGIPAVPMESLVTEDAQIEFANWKKLKGYGGGVDNLINGSASKDKQDSHDTVGCVAIDKDGNVASGTSTGGIHGKMVGRVGDAPLVGCGAYADNRVGAASATGHGESIMRVALTRHVLFLMETQGLPPNKAARAAVDYMFERTGGGCGGLIVVSKDGSVGYAHTSERMVWAAIEVDGKRSAGIDPGASPLFGAPTPQKQNLSLL